MNWVILVVALIALTGVMAALYLRRAAPPDSGRSSQDGSYQLCPALLTPAELEFCQVLRQAVGDRWAVFAKVRVADVLIPERGLSKSDWQRAFNKISAKHFDFVLCAPNTSQVQVAIELDDRSHRRPNRRDRDEFLNAIAQQAGLSLLRFPAQSSYSAAEIEAQIVRSLRA